MSKDREAIEKIIQYVPEEGEDQGKSPLPSIIDALELYVKSERIKALGWTYADCCMTIDAGLDPKFEGVPKILQRMEADLLGKRPEPSRLVVVK